MLKLASFLTFQGSATSLSWAVAASELHVAQPPAGLGAERGGAAEPRLGPVVEDPTWDRRPVEADPPGSRGKRRLCGITRRSSDAGRLLELHPRADGEHLQPLHLERARPVPSTGGPCPSGRISHPVLPPEGRGAVRTLGDTGFRPPDEVSPSEGRLEGPLSSSALRPATCVGAADDTVSPR
ncbi:hypothetical protein J1605_021110 [Eschrichtius robustus]|uniref:Secreted protein n=1 Tax=Eschrichtius robustus TaxID=9764 RepID=A0AB34HJ43_ESCRO|nr:hypothetical protein J1605_021110 [Eschrichtius robustus]